MSDGHELLAKLIAADDLASVAARSAELGKLAQDARLTIKQKPPTSLTFHKLRVANLARCLKWHPEGIESWSASDWMTALTGEVGELASLLKMRNRERDGLPGNKFSPTVELVAKEIADVAIYLDLLAEYFNIDLGKAIADKFNEVSERVGFPDRIELDFTPDSNSLEKETPSDEWSNPDWSKKRKCHEWKNYINEEVQQMWHTFTDAQKQALIRQADELSDKEDWE